MDRRAVLRTLAAGTTVALAGCFEDDAVPDVEEPEPAPDDDDPDDEDTPELDTELRVATTRAIADGDDTAGAWLREAFEAVYEDATLVWTVPDSGVDHYVQQYAIGAEIGADLYFGLDVGDLVRIDDRLDERDLFVEPAFDRLQNVDRADVAVDLGDPAVSILPYGLRYVGLVYDAEAVDRPETLADLLDPAYEDDVIVPDAASSRLGEAFLYWTVDAFGDDYLAYWEGLVANGAKVVHDWPDALEAYDDDGHVVVSYSTLPERLEDRSTDDGFIEQIGDEPIDSDRIVFPNGTGYVRPEAMAIFDGAQAADLAYAFVTFVRSPEVQRELAVRNAHLPVVNDVDLPPTLASETIVPNDPVALPYAEIREHRPRWIAEWADVVHGDDVDSIASTTDARLT